MVYIPVFFLSQCISEISSPGLVYIPRFFISSSGIYTTLKILSWNFEIF